MTHVRLLHGFTHFHDLGGVQSMLRRHHTADATQGFDSRFLAYFESREPRTERVQGLGLGGRTTVRGARDRFAAACGSPTDCCAYHNCWGLTLFADLDQSARRLGILHTDFPGITDCLPRLRGLLDGLLCVSQPLLDLGRRALPELDGERLAWLPYPVREIPGAPAQAPTRDRAWVIGFAGRLAFAQKRVDRFPELARRLQADGVPFRLEFLGDGPQGAWLRRQFAGSASVVFHGQQAEPAYTEILRRWDVVAYVSDYEGLPITLLEALACGVIPLYPRIGSGGDGYAAQISPDLLYPAGDMAAAAAAVKRLVALDPASVSAWRDHGRSLVRPHQGDAYERVFAGVLRQLIEWPRISRPAAAYRRDCWSDWVPLGVLRRFAPHRLWQPRPLSAG